MISYHIEASFSDEVKAYFPNPEYKVTTRTFNPEEEGRLDYLEFLLKETITHLKCKYGNHVTAQVIDLKNFNYANIVAKDNFTVKINHHFKVKFTLINHRESLRGYVKDILANESTGIVDYKTYSEITSSPLNYTNSRYHHILTSDEMELFGGEECQFHTNIIFLMLYAKHNYAAVEYIKANEGLLAGSKGIISFILGLENNSYNIQETPTRLRDVMFEYLDEYRSIHTSDIEYKEDILNLSWAGLRLFFDLYHRKYYAFGKVLGLYSTIAYNEYYSLNFNNGTVTLSDDTSQLRFIDNLPSPILGLGDEIADLKRLVSELEGSAFSDENFASKIRAIEKLTKNVKTKHINQAVTRRMRKDVAAMYHVSGSTITLMTR